MSSAQEIYEPDPGQGAGLPGGLAPERGPERGSELAPGRRDGLEYKHDRCPGVKGDNLPTQ